LAWDLGNEVGARILRHPFCFCWFAGVSCWTKPSLHHHPSYKMFINMEPRHSVSSRPGSFTKWWPWRHRVFVQGDTNRVNVFGVRVKKYFPGGFLWIYKYIYTKIRWYV
jgi:hypothetical protein